MVSFFIEKCRILVILSLIMYKLFLIYMLVILYFKEVIVMVINCDVCGERINEVKLGGKLF